MDLQPRTLDAVKEEEWDIISDDWWRLPFGSVSWSYSRDNQTGPKFGHPQPPHYHESQFHASVAGSQPSDASLELNSLSSTETDVLLNPNLPGILGANDVLAPYEADVGFHCSDSLDLRQIEDGGKSDLSIEVGEDKVACSKKCWDRLVERLFRGLTDLQEESAGDAEGDGRSDGSIPSSIHGLHRSTSTLSSVDFTDSDLSGDSSSVPSTPKAKSAEVDIEVANTSPTSSLYYSAASSPTRSLNASASSFVPWFIKPANAPIPFPCLATPETPSPPATFVNFTFPSLDAPPLPTVNIKKDEQGFYSEVEAPSLASQPSRPSSTLLPPFLQERRKAPVSKTRAMVERLRSFNQSQDVFGPDKGTPVRAENASQSPSPSPPLYNLEFLKERLSTSDDGRGRTSGVSSPSTTLDEDEDGWINIADGQATQESKARRTRDLFLALTRRRSDSMPPMKLQVSEEHGDDIGETTISATCSSSPSPSPLSHLNDGWIEGPAPAPKHVARSRPGRKRRSSNVPSPLPIIPHFALPTTLNPTPYAPPPYFYPAYPPVMSPMPYASYMQMQFQMQQMQRRAHEGLPSPSGEWFPYANSAQPGMGPAPPFSNPSMSMNTGSLSAMRNGLQW